MFKHKRIDLSLIITYATGMNCPNCRQPVPPGAQFCGNCGALLSAPAGSQPNPVPTPQPAPPASPAPPGAPVPLSGALPPVGVPVAPPSPGFAPPPSGMAYINQESDKNYMTAFLLSILVGIVGADRFYMGQIGVGILKLLTLGGFGLWWLIDTVLLVAGVRKDKFGRDLAGHQKNFKTSLIIFLVLFGLGIVSYIYYISTPIHSTAQAPITATASRSNGGAGMSTKAVSW